MLKHNGIVTTIAVVTTLCHYTTIARAERSGEYLQLVTTITDYVVMSFWIVVVLWYFLKCHSDEFKFKCVEDFLICSPFYHVLETLGLEDAGVLFNK